MDSMGSQPLVVNGLAFNRQGELFNADTARGAIWKVEFKPDGTLKSRTGCDPVFTDKLSASRTFTSNMFCLKGPMASL